MDTSRLLNEPAPAAACFADCFRADKIVDFAILGRDIWSGGNVAPSRSATGPIIKNGQTVTGQTFFFDRKDAAAWAYTRYWTVTDSGVMFIGVENSNGDARMSNPVPLPCDMKPGQTIGNAVFVGFEKVTLASKTFHNTCHLRVTNDSGAGDIWYAPGYGAIKMIAPGLVMLYNGDIPINRPASGANAIGPIA